ncbi:MAG: hypothetical protein J1E33_07035 [Alistipes sp.]|nr:hypothetical protein [Alistipes sp.]
MNHKLSELISAIRAVPLTDALTDDAVTALSHCYISMQNMAAADGLESECGNSREFEQALDTLYGICRKRCAAGEPPERRCRMVSVLHMIAGMRMGVTTDMRRWNECCDLMWQAVDEVMKRQQHEADSASVYGALRCICDLFGYVAEEERNADPDFRWYRRHIEEWAAALNDDGTWDGLSVDEALCRLDIMCRNSNMLADSSHDAAIGKACGVCCRTALEHLRRTEGDAPGDCGRRLFMLGEVVTHGLGEVGCDATDDIAEYASRQAARHPRGSDEWLFCSATLLDRLCMQLAEQLRNRLLAHSA